MPLPGHRFELRTPILGGAPIRDITGTARGLLTIEAAKTNPEVNKALRQYILGGVDARMDEIIKEIGLAVGEDFLNEKNSYEKTSILAEMLHQHRLKKSEGNSKEDLSELLKNERAGFSKKEMELQKQLKQLADSRRTIVRNLPCRRSC